MACVKMIHSLIFKSENQYSPPAPQPLYRIAGSPLLTFIYQDGLQTTSVPQNKIYSQRMSIYQLLLMGFKKMP